MKLRDLASVRSGLVLARKQSREPTDYRYPLINLRCIRQQGEVDLDEADIYEAKEPLREEYLSQSGDIIVRLTAPYTAVLVDETTAGMVISSNFVVIRVEDDRLLPEYLFWLLNTRMVKRKIYENTTSNMLGAVNAKFLTDFELALLPAEEQRKIARFNLLAKKERQLLKELAEEKVPSGKVAICGQELNAQTWALCAMNMFLHGVDDARIWQGDTLSDPQNIEDDHLMKFQVVVANPPFSLDKWDSGFLSEAEADGKRKKMTAGLDQYRRFDWGVPPASKGDYAFVLHMLSCLDAENGRMAVVLPHGVLFRGAAEGKIRRQLVEMNLLDAVVGLPANLFYGTSIPACILLFKKNRTRRDVLFIDASGEGNFEKGKNQNLLRGSDIARIVSAYEAWRNEDKYSYAASFEEIKKNDFNLNVPWYVDTFEEEELVDIGEVQRKIAGIEAELAQVQAQMKKYLEELGL